MPVFIRQETEDI